MPYILEVQKFIYNGHILYPEWNGKKEHIGYINKIFRTRFISKYDQKGISICL